MKYYKDRRKENRFVPIFTQKSTSLCKEVLFYFDHLQNDILNPTESLHQEREKRHLQKLSPFPGSFIQIVRIKINYATNICHFLILPYDLFPEFKLTVLFNIKDQSVYYHQLASKIIL